MRLLRSLAAPGLPGHLGALLLGATLTLAFAPFGYWPLAVLAPLGLLALLARLDPTAVALRAWCFGAGLFGAGASWVYVSIHVYGAAPVPLAAGLTAAFCIALGLFPAITFWAWARWLRERRGGIALGFAAAWTLGEWWRGWFLTGFPWLYLGYSQVDGPLAGWLPVAGTLGASLIAAFSAAALYLTLSRSRRGPLLLALAATLWLAAPVLERIQWTSAEGAPLQAALVQGNIEQNLKWEPGQLEAIIEVYAGLSEPLWGTPLVVWPESAVPAYLDLLVERLIPLAMQAHASGSALLFGVPTREANRAQRRGFDAYNSIAVLGEGSGLYHKRRLVPFGEYVPLERWLRGLIAFFDLPMSSFSRGPANQAPLYARGVAIAPSVCYEIAYADQVARGARDASVLLTVSNDTWFGASIGPLQHLQIARVRALETGRPLIRATNDGVSALIDAHGNIIIQGARFSREVIRGSIQPTRGLTPFVRFGSTPLLLLLGIACAALVLAPRRS